MARVTVEDVAEGLRVRWQSVTALEALIPVASVYVGRAAEGTAFPYCVLTVTETAGIDMTGGWKLQRFAVRFEVYVSDNPPSANTIRAALNAAFNGRSGDPASGVSVTGAVGVVHCKDAPAAGDKTELTGVRHNNADTLKLTASYELLVESRA